MALARRIISGLLGFLLLGLALTGFESVAMMGFPDGHLTDLDRATRFPLHVLCYGTLLLGLGFIYLAARKRPVSGLVLAAWILAFVLLVAGPYCAVTYYFKYHLGLDNGFGG